VKGNEYLQSQWIGFTIVRFILRLAGGKLAGGRNRRTPFFLRFWIFWGLIFLARSTSQAKIPL